MKGFLECSRSVNTFIFLLKWVWCYAIEKSGWWCGCIGAVRVENLLSRQSPNHTTVDRTTSRFSIGFQHAD